MKYVFTRMKQVSDIMLDAALAELRSIRQQQAGHQKAIEDLRRKKVEIHRLAVASENPIEAILHAETWNTWHQKEIITHNSALAQLNVMAEEAELKARQQFGRQQATQNLQQKQLSAQKSIAQRRAAQT